MYVYLIFLLAFFLVPLVAVVWIVGRDLIRYQRTLLWCLGFVYTIGWLWDWLSVRTGVWRYDSAETVGLWVGGLPVEEFVGFYVLGTLLIVSVILAIRKHVR